MKQELSRQISKQLLLILLCSLCLPFVSEKSFAQTSIIEPQVVGSGDSGELNSLYLDNLASELRSSQAELLFVIARPGRGERARSLNHNRLESARRYLIESGRIQKERIIFAEGEPVDGEGRVEFYLGSRLYLTSLAKRGRNINFTCCDDSGSSGRKRRVRRQRSR